MDKKKSLQELASQSALLFGSQEKEDMQHKLGKLTARERIGALLDRSSFVELDKFYERTQATAGFECTTAAGEGVITGFGTMDGRPVYVFAQDYTVLSGSMSTAQAQKIIKIMDMAIRNGSPVIGILDSGGSRVAEGAAAMGAYSSIIKKLNELSGVVPTIVVVSGPCIGAAACMASLIDFTVAVDQVTTLLLHGPQIETAAREEQFDSQKVGGALAASENTGIAEFFANNENEAFALVRRLLAFLPQNNLDDPLSAVSDDLNRQLPELDSKEHIETSKMISEIADHQDFFEVHARFATEIITGFIRLNGNTVGVVANRSGSFLNTQSAKKAARFLNLLDAYHIPVLTLTDCGDIPPGISDDCIITALSGLLQAYAQASVPMVTVVTGQAVGSGLLAMGPKQIGADIVYAWSNALISAMPPEAGALLYFEEQVKSAEDPIAERLNAIQKYKNEFVSAFAAAKQGLVDDVIAPSATRQMVIAAFEACSTKRLRVKQPKKHGILPL